MGTLARRLQLQEQEQVQTAKETAQRVSKVRKNFLSAKERMLIIVFALIMVLLAINIIQTQNQSFSVNKENIQLQAKVDEQTKVNKELTNQVDELSTSERIIAKANELGLTLNDKNVKVVQD